MHKKMINISVKVPFSAVGGVVAILEPTIDYIIVCTIAVLCDTFTAWQLSRRVNRKYPGKNDGRFKSQYAMRIITTLLKIYALIALATLIDKSLFPETDMMLGNIVAGVFCFIQIWSMLENESSLSDKKWAKVLQKIMVNKAERHFNVDLSELKKDEKDKENNTTNSSNC